MAKETLYILTRTSGRPEFFKRCRETVNALKWPGPKIHIVHTDDPRDLDHVEGDIIIQGECLSPTFGRGFYNKYCNRLLKAVPRNPEGWIHFMDDDDEYLGPNVLNFLHGQDRKVLHVFKTRRKGMSKGQKEVMFPKYWKNQPSFQTECFAVWSDIAKKYRWWAQKGGDHQYTRKITRKYPIKWHDTLASQAQERKGHGKRMDAGKTKAYKKGHMDPKQKVHFKMFKNVDKNKANQLIHIPAHEAEIMERHGVGRITFKGITHVQSDNH